MKTTLLFLMLVFGTLAIHVDVDKDEFIKDDDVEYLFSEVYDSDGFSEVMGEPIQQIVDPTITATTPSYINQFLPPITPGNTVTPTIATWNSVNTGNSLNTGNSMLNTGNSMLNTGNSMLNTGNSMLNTVSNSWQERVSKSQEAILSQAFFKVYKELTSSYQQTGVNGAFPPLSCQTVVTEQKICFICPPAFGILQMFDSRCNWIPAVNAVEPFKKEQFKLMSDDIFEDLRKMYAKLQMNSPAESTIGQTQLDFPVIPSEEQSTMQISGGYSMLLPDDPAVTMIADFAVKELKYNIKTVTSSYVFNGITSAEKQVVAGANYRITLDFVDVNSKHLYCSVEVSQSLAALDIPSLTNHVCI